MAETDGTSRVWFITGTSTGMGRAFAEEVLAHGDRVVATARRLEDIADYAGRYGERALACRVDVTDRASIDAAVVAALERFGKIDVVVNNAGYGLFGAIEEASDDELRHQFDTNVFGAIAVIQAVLPAMRAAGSGAIVNISSMGGFSSSASLGAYGASKAALEGFSEALAGEVYIFGVRVLIVEPGVFRTDWIEHSRAETARKIGAYAPIIEPRREAIAASIGNQPGDPRKAARAVIEEIENPTVRLRLMLGVETIERVRAKLKTVESDAKLSEKFDTTFN
jgi:NAD(P)-dependent dehydrogenase (short-subunit alcohol dehydrogenase family)